VLEKVVGQLGTRVDGEDLVFGGVRTDDRAYRSVKEGVSKVIDLIASRRFGMFAGAVGASVTQFLQHGLTDSVLERAELLKSNQAWDGFWSAYAEWSAGTLVPPLGSKVLVRRPAQNGVDVDGLPRGGQDWSGEREVNVDMAGLRIELEMTEATLTNAEPTDRYLAEDEAEASSYIRSGSGSQYGRMSPLEKSLFQKRRLISRHGGSGAVWYDASLEIVAMYDQLKGDNEHRRWPVGGAEAGERVSVQRVPSRTRWSDIGVNLVSRGPPRRGANGQVADPSWDPQYWHPDELCEEAYVDGGAGGDAEIYYSRNLPERARAGHEKPVAWSGWGMEGEQQRVLFLTESEYLTWLVRDVDGMGPALRGLWADAVQDPDNYDPKFDASCTYVAFASREQLENDVWLCGQMEFWLRTADHLQRRGSSRTVTGVQRLIFVALDFDGVLASVPEAVLRIGCRLGQVPRAQWLTPAETVSILGDESNWGAGGDWYTELDYRNAFSFLSSQCVFFGRHMEPEEQVFFSAEERTDMGRMVWRRFWEVGVPTQRRVLTIMRSPPRSRYLVRTRYAALAEGLGYVRCRPGSLESFGEWARRRAACGGALVDAYAGALGAGLVFSGDLFQYHRAVADLTAMFSYAILEMSFGSQLGAGRFRWADGRSVGCSVLPFRPVDPLRFAGDPAAVDRVWVPHVRYPWARLWPALAVGAADRPYNPIGGTAIPNMDMAGESDPIGVLQGGVLSAGSTARLKRDPYLAAQWLGDGHGVTGGGGVRIISPMVEGSWSVRLPRFLADGVGGGGNREIILPFLPPRMYRGQPVSFKWHGWTGTGSSEREVAVGFVSAGLTHVPEAFWTQGEFLF